MIKWLQNYAGIGTSGQNIEQVELENLRKEVKKYRKKYAKEDQEMEVSSESSEEISPEEQARIDEEMKKKQTQKKTFRVSVSAEAFGVHNQKKDFKPRNIPKTEEQKKSILDKCGKSFMFSTLEDNELNTVLAAFEEKRYAPGESVIVQGDQGDVLYLVDQGELDCEKVFKAGDPPTHLKGNLNKYNSTYSLSTRRIFWRIGFTL
ncbi:MAG: hypothetical protein MJ252_13425 [archaeon]|nr:hypothetical protein [archaeon]